MPIIKQLRNLNKIVIWTCMKIGLSPLLDRDILVESDLCWKNKWRRKKRTERIIIVNW